MATASQQPYSAANLVRDGFVVAPRPLSSAIIIVKALIKANALLWAGSGQGLKS